MAIQSQPLIPASILLSADGLCLEDVHFAKIQPTLWMRTMPIEILEKWIEGRSFNPEQMAEGDYSHSTAILIVLNPSTQCIDLESTCIRLIVCQHKAPVGKIAKVLNLIKYAHSLMQAEGQSSEPVHRTICTIMGNYGRHMAFTMDPPFCITYPLYFSETDYPTQMTFSTSITIQFFQEPKVSCVPGCWELHRLRKI